MGARSSTSVALYKVAVVGAPGVGKTTIVRGLAGKPPRPRYRPTPKVKVHSVLVGTDCVVQLHDVGGNAPVRMADRTLQDADAVMLVYDHLRLWESLQVLMKDWMPRLYANTRPLTLFILTAWNVPPYPNESLLYFPLSEDIEFTCYEQLPDSRRRVMRFGNLKDVQDIAGAVLLQIVRTIRTIESTQQA